MAATVPGEGLGVRCTLEHEGAIALVTLDRPDKRNAVNAAMTRAIGDFLEKAEADRGVRAVVFASSSDVFCAGADLGELAKGNADALRTPAGGFAGTVFLPHAKPWIAAVPGPALAGGCEIVLACDIVIAAPEARFGLPEVRRGLIAGAGGAYRLPERVPLGLALEMLLCGDSIDAAEACRSGLVNRVVPRPDLLEAALGIARRIAANAPLAVTEAMALVRATRGRDEDFQRDASRAASDRLVATADAREGARAFIEKRTPAWQGC